jgi:Fe-S oxidoreductase
VDIPEMRSHFLDVYYLDNRRPLADRAVMALEAISPLADLMRPVLRAAAQTGLSEICAGLLGFRDMPVSSPVGLRALGFELVSADTIAARPADQRDVLVLPDPFTALFDTGAVASIARGIAALGWRPLLLKALPGGKAAHVKGDRKRFTRQARRLAEQLALAGASGRPIVGVDPAMVEMLRSEYVKAAIEPSVIVLSPEEFVVRRIEEGMVPPAPETSSPQRKVFLHCTEKSLRPQTMKAWRQVFDHLGIAVDVVESGCCGMSGMFGHERRHFDWSMRLYDMSWRGIVDGEPIVYATGFSCRSQVKRCSHKPAFHPMELIASRYAPAPT